MRLLLILPLTAGCRADPTRTDAQPDSDPFIVVPGCDIDVDATPDLQSTVTDVGTVVRLTWSSDEAQAKVVFGTDGDRLLVTNTLTASDGRFTVLLRGFPAHATLHYRVVGGEDAQPTCGAERAIETGGLPAELPVLDFAGTPGSYGEFIVTPLITEDGSFATIVNAEGEVVWAWPTGGTTWRARLAADGEGLLVNHPAETLEGEGEVLRIGFDGEETTLWRATGLHTDFTELPDGTLAGLVWNVQDVDSADGTYRVAGDDLVEHSPEGEDTTLWSSFERFTPDLTRPWSHGIGGEDDDVLDWSHTNGVSYSAEANAYFLSLDGLEALVSVGRAPLGQLWSVASEGGDYRPERGDLIENPHSFYRIADHRYLVFDRNNPGSDDCSVASIFALDDARMVAPDERSYQSPDCLNVYYLGEAQPIPGDGMLIVWSTSGRLERLDADYTSAWTLTARLGAGAGFSEDVPTLYPLPE